jgi:hypothetical protein
MVELFSIVRLEEKARLMIEWFLFLANCGKLAKSIRRRLWSHIRDHPNVEVVFAFIPITTNESLALRCAVRRHDWRP